MTQVSAGALATYHINVSPVFAKLAERLAQIPIPGDVTRSASGSLTVSGAVGGPDGIRAHLEVTASGVVSTAAPVAVPLNVSGLMQMLTVLGGAVAAFDVGTSATSYKREELLTGLAALLIFVSICLFWLALTDPED